MEIKRTVDSLGRTTHTITLTDQENAVIDAALEIIIVRYTAAGNVPSARDCESTEWALLGILRDEGMLGVQGFAENYKALPPSCRV